MRITDGYISNFKELLNEFFYDWNMGPHQKLIKNSEGFFINKTALFKEDNRYILSYKTDSWEVSSHVFEKMNKFFNLYKGDSEFQKVLDAISLEWGNNELEKQDKIFTIGQVQIVKKENSYFFIYQNNAQIISHNTFQKVSHLWSLLKSI